MSQLTKVHTQNSLQTPAQQIAHDYNANSSSTTAEKSCEPKQDKPSLGKWIAIGIVTLFSFIPGIILYHSVRSLCIMWRYTALIKQGVIEPNTRIMQHYINPANSAPGLIFSSFIGFIIAYILLRALHKTIARKIVCILWIDIIGFMVLIELLGYVFGLIISIFLSYVTYKCIWPHNDSCNAADVTNAPDITYIDNRSKGGALWVIGGQELQPYFDTCQQNGIKFYFKPEGGYASCGKPAWWTTDKTAIDDILIYFNKR